MLVDKSWPMEVRVAFSMSANTWIHLARSDSSASCRAVGPCIAHSKYRALYLLGRRVVHEQFLHLPVREGRQLLRDSRDATAFFVFVLRPLQLLKPTSRTPPGSLWEVLHLARG